MVISMSGQGWHCWRVHNHKGGHPAKLVSALLRCSISEAYKLTNVGGGYVPTGALDRITAALTRAQPTINPEASLTFPDAFKVFKDTWSATPFLAYLRGRGFAMVPRLLTDTHGLYYCTQGSYHGRIIFPMWQHGRLLSWVGRTIYSAEEQRYKAHTVNPAVARAQNLEPALAASRNCLLWHDKLYTTRAPILVIAEGPFDALKINVLARGRAFATCWTSSSPTAAQIDLLRPVASRFQKRILLSDVDLATEAYATARLLVALNFDVAQLPRTLKDPAQLRSHDELLQLLH